VFALGAFVFVVLWFILDLVEPAEAPVVRAEYAMAVAIAVALAAALMSARQDRHDDSRLICPQCDCTLGYYYVMIVLHSRNCPHCGERVLDD
jgi:hypothetical protein